MCTPVRVVLFLYLFVATCNCDSTMNGHTRAVYKNRYSTLKSGSGLTGSELLETM